MTVIPLNAEAPKKRIDQKTVDALEELLEKAKRGELRDVVIVGLEQSPGEVESYFYHTHLEDLWKTLGAISYAQLRVGKLLTEPRDL